MQGDHRTDYVSTLLLVVRSVHTDDVAILQRDTCRHSKPLDSLDISLLNVWTPLQIDPFRGESAQLDNGRLWTGHRSGFAAAAIFWTGLNTIGYAMKAVGKSAG
jgi:hypothetical protein